MSNNEKVRQEASILFQEYTFLQRYAEELSAYLNNVNAALMEASLARKSIDELSKAEEKELLVSLDRNGNAFIKTEIKEKNKVVVNIGGDYYLYTTVNRAAEILDEKISELERSRKDIEKELTKILSRIEQIKQQLAVLQERLSKQETQK